MKTEPITKCPQCGATLPAGALAGLCPACLLKQGAAPDTATQPEARSFEPPPVADLARLFPQLEIVAFLGKGGMGAVYKARQPALDRFVALKILPARGGDDPGFADRFTREARALARLSHPNIIAVHEFGRANGLHYFIMEFVDGVNLRQLQKMGRLSPREALQIVPQICDALQYAHDEGVVHRDIKPENVLVDRKGRVKIADFGLAKIMATDPADLRLTDEGQVMGTPHYMAPEQVEHPLEVDHRADIFSLGVVFYEMLTGELPLGKFQPPSRKVAVDVRLDEVVLHALEKEPERRYQQANQVKTAVQTIATTAPSASGARVIMTVPKWAAGVEYKSKATLWGLPLLHVATGVDPVTGKRRTAKGIIALGNVAKGVVAIGGVAMGFISLGGLSIGVIAFGGGAIGLLAMGGGALGLVAAIGGGAIAPIALGGGALGYFAFGGGAGGAHTVSAVGLDPAAWDFFQPWIEPFFRRFLVGSMIFGGLVVLLSSLVPAWLQRKDPEMTRSAGYWAQIAVALICSVLLLLPAMLGAFSQNLNLGNLVSGNVSDATTGFSISECTISEPSSQPGRSIFQVHVGGDGRFWLLTRKAPIVLEFAARSFETNVVTLSSESFGRKRHAELDIKLKKILASTELWSPEIAPGEKPDLNRIRDEANNLTQRGRYEEALQRYLWYYNHALEYEPSMSGVRLSFLLSDWTELARRYPKAKNALVEIRDHDAQEFMEGRGYFALFMDLNAVNGYLQEDDATIEVFKHMDAKDPALAAQCYRVVEPLLVQKGLYKLCAKYVTDPEARLAELVRNWKMQKESEERMAEQHKQMAKRMTDLRGPAPPYPMPEVPKLADKNFVAQTRRLVEILLGVGKRAEAQKIGDEAFALLPDPGFKSAVADAEAHVKQ